MLPEATRKHQIFMKEKELNPKIFPLRSCCRGHLQFHFYPIAPKLLSSWDDRERYQKQVDNMAVYKVNEKKEICLDTCLVEVIMKT